VVLLLEAVFVLVALVHLAGRVGEFGALAVSGQGSAWAFTVAAAVGVVACMLVIVVLVMKTLRTLGFIRDYKPRRAASRRR